MRCTIVLCVVLVSLACASHAQSRTDSTAKSSSTLRKVFTAPDPAMVPPSRESEVLPIVYASAEEISPPEHRRPIVKFYELQKGNGVNMASGFYAEFRPPDNDTLFLYDSASDHYNKVQIRAGKEVIQGDSASVVHDVTSRLSQYDEQGRLMYPKKKGQTHSTVIRSGFIPAQGFGSKRYRFAVIPGNFTLTMNSIISASVHMLHGGSDLGTVLCAITKVDYEHNRFFVETSNEIPLGENINWIIVNAP